MAPKLMAEALRFPGEGRLSVSSSSSGNSPFELRTGLSYSPTDALRGHLLQRVGDADCRAHAAALQIDELLLQATDRSELAAHRAELQQLAGQRGAWQAALEDAGRALAAGLLTLGELHELRRSTRALEERWLDAELTIARLEVRLAGSVSASGALGNQYVERSLELEQAAARLRTLDAWSLTLAGGVAPLGGNQPEWFAFAELSYNLGGLFQPAREARYLQAREEELRQAPYERKALLSSFRKVVGAEFSTAQRKLESSQLELGVLQQAQASFAGVDASSAAQGRTRVALDRIGVEADIAFLQAKIRELSQLLESLRDS